MKKKIKYIILIVLSIIAIIVGFVLGQKPKAIERKNAPSVQQVNLLRIENKEPTTSSGVTYSIKNGEITINGTAVSTSNLFNVNVTNVLISGNTYTIANLGDTNFNLVVGIQETISSSEIYVTNQFTYIGSYRVRVFFQVINGHNYNNAKVKPMLVQGTTEPTSFSPFHELEEKTNIIELWGNNTNYEQYIFAFELPMENGSIFSINNFNDGVVTSIFNFSQTNYNSLRYDLKINNETISEAHLIVRDKLFINYRKVGNKLYLKIETMAVEYDIQTAYNYDFYTIYENNYTINTSSELLISCLRDNLYYRHYDYAINGEEWKNTFDISAFTKGALYQWWYGYKEGYQMAQQVVPETSIITIVESIADSMASVLNIEILPHLTIGTICSIPLVFGVILLILKLIRGD